MSAGLRVGSVGIDDAEGQMYDTTIVGARAPARRPPCCWRAADSRCCSSIGRHSRARRSRRTSSGSTAPRSRAVGFLVQTPAAGDTIDSPADDVRRRPVRPWRRDSRRERRQGRGLSRRTLLDKLLVECRGRRRCRSPRRLYRRRPDHHRRDSCGYSRPWARRGSDSRSGEGFRHRRRWCEFVRGPSAAGTGYDPPPCCRLWLLLGTSATSSRTTSSCTSAIITRSAACRPTTACTS